MGTRMYVCLSACLEDQSACPLVDQSACLIADQSACLLVDQSACLLVDQSARLPLGNLHVCWWTKVHVYLSTKVPNGICPIAVDPSAPKANVTPVMVGIVVSAKLHTCHGGHCVVGNISRLSWWSCGVGKISRLSWWSWDRQWGMPCMCHAFKFEITKTPPRSATTDAPIVRTNVPRCGLLMRLVAGTIGGGARRWRYGGMHDR